MTFCHEIPCISYIATYLQKREIEKKLFLFFKQECITASVHQYPLNNKDINSSEINKVNVSWNTNYSAHVLVKDLLGVL